MDIEFATDYLCQGFLGKLDPTASGVVVEIGLGSLNYSFQWAAPLGHRCIAVEPLPTDSLIAATKAHDVELIPAAMGELCCEVPIYHGYLHGHPLPDISSLNPRWWGVSDSFTMVPCLTISHLCFSKAISSMALLKVDTEGSESQILGCLPELPLSLLPEIIVFEYGGGGRLRDGTGGWSIEFKSGLVQLLAVLKKCQYQAAVVVESQRRWPRWFLGPDAFDFEQLFGEDFRVGNLILVRDASKVSSLRRVTRLSLPRLWTHNLSQLVRQNVARFSFLVARIHGRINRLSKFHLQR